MYDKTQIIRGLREPTLAKCEIQQKWQHFSAYFPHDIGIQGSYWTTNIGDRAIGEILSSILTDMGFRARLFSNKVEYCNAPVRILGGGGVLHDFYGTDHLRRRLNFINDNGVIIGVGVPGIRSDDASSLLEKRLSEIDLISVRDERSRQQLQPFTDTQIHTTACPSLLHENPNSSSSGRTGVNFLSTFSHNSEIMSYYFGYEDDIDIEEAKKKYISNIKYICNNVKNPIYIPFHKNDEKFARKHLNVDVYPYVFSVEKTLKRVSEVDRMVTMRYHSLVFSIICQKPVLVINYNPKVSSLAERIDVSSYRPHEDIPIKFETISNRNKIREAAAKNFDLLQDHFIKKD